jgi:hypothetical protein
MVSFVGSLIWMSAVMRADAAVWELIGPSVLLGVANGFVWSPLSTTATRNLPLEHAGAGAGVYNTTRQIGAVLGSAGIAVLIESRLAANLPVAEGGGGDGFAVAQLPPALHGGFSASMGEAALLPAGVLLIGLVAVLAFARPRHLVSPDRPARAVRSAA